MRYVTIDEVNPGAVMAETLFDVNGLPLIMAGGRLSARAINGLRRRGICEIVVEDEISKGIEVTSLVSLATKRAIIDSLKKLDIEKVQFQAKNMVAELLENNTSIADVQTIKSYDEYTYQHSYSVGLLSAVMGIASQFKMADIEKLACAGLLHDLGKICISTDIINAPRKLTEEEFAEIKKHPENTYNMLQSNFDLSATVKVAAYEHHENEDGTGYPRGLHGDRIHRFAKIIHICDVFDALTSNRPYRDPMSREDALTYIKEHTDNMFSQDYATIFAGCIPAYPTGTVFTVSTGETAIVVRNNPRDINNPLVRIAGSMREVYLKDIEIETA